MGVADFQPTQGGYPLSYVPAGMELNYHGNMGMNTGYGRSQYELPPHHLPQHDGQADIDTKINRMSQKV